MKADAIPKDCPDCGIYLLSEADLHLYVGRTRKFRQRLGSHSRPSAGPNHASFAFRLAREATGRLETAYSGEGIRSKLMEDPLFSAAFSESKARIRKMDLRFVEECDPLRQALLEIYVAIALGTQHNSFQTH